MSTKEKRKLKSRYFIMINVIIIVSFSFCASLLFFKTYKKTNDFKVNYAEKSNIDYTVCLKENDFYEQECLNKDMQYISNLIDKINFSFQYSFNTDELMHSKYNYSVIAKLIIFDPSNEKNIMFSKNYTLAEEVSEEITNNNFKIFKEITIDYEDYNLLANKFKSTYGILASAKLNIYLKTNNNSYAEKEENLKIDKDTELFVSIPLSQSSLNIEIEKALINNNDTIYYKSVNKISNYSYFIISILSFIVALLFIIRLFIYIRRRYNVKNEYDKALAKILKEYDRAIAESLTTIKLKTNNNIIIIKSFEELLDIRDNLQVPIIFNEIKKGRESWFYVKDKDDIYIFVLKYEEKSNEKGKQK